MSLGLVGKKVGMTRIFQEDGRAVPVTVVHVEDNRVTQVRSLEKDGYCAVQVTAGSQKASRLNKAEAGTYAKAGVEPGRGFWEFRVEQEQADALAPGANVEVSVFEEGQKVDVRAKSIGKGFQGAMKRHGFGGGRATHGNSLSHRALGSTGQNQDPGRVFPGKKMPGQMGAVMKTTEMLPIVRIDNDRSLLLIKGAIPGPKGQYVVVTPASKAGATGALYDPAAAKAAQAEAAAAAEAQTADNVEAPAEEAKDGE